MRLIEEYMDFIAYIQILLLGYLIPPSLFEINFLYSRLIELNLEGNNGGDYSLIGLAEAIEFNNKIRILNLGKNMLSDNAGEALGKMLEMNTSLRELYLRWNNIKGKGGIAILDGLKNNDNLKVLDFSWNSLGLHGSPFAQAFSDYIAQNETLIHLDLSNNSFGKEQSVIISQGLEQNHTLYGFHFSGNFGYVDSKGFLVVSDDYAQKILNHRGDHMIKGNYRTSNIKNLKTIHNVKNYNYLFFSTTP